MADDTKTEKPEAPPAKQTAADYLIPISPEALGKWHDDPEGFLKYAQEVAKGMYPTLAGQLDKHTTKTLVDPYVQVAKSVLGQDVSPDWTDPKWSVALDGGTDPSTGRPTLMPLTAWKQRLMSDPGHGFDESPAAHDKVNGLIAHLSQQFHGVQNGN